MLARMDSISRSQLTSSILNSHECAITATSYCQNMYLLSIFSRHSKFLLLDYLVLLCCVKYAEGGTQGSHMAGKGLTTFLTCPPQPKMMYFFLACFFYKLFSIIIVCEGMCTPQHTCRCQRRMSRVGFLFPSIQRFRGWRSLDWLIQKVIYTPNHPINPRSLRGRGRV